jgi:hypothetical protein
VTAPTGASWEHPRAPKTQNFPSRGGHRHRAAGATPGARPPRSALGGPRTRPGRRTAQRGSAALTKTTFRAWRLSHQSVAATTDTDNRNAALALPRSPREFKKHGTCTCRVVLLWATWCPTEAHAAVLLCPGYHDRPCRSTCRRAVVQAMSVDVAPWPLCRSARRRAAVLWLLTWHHAEAHAAVLLCPRAADARAL